MEFESWLAFCSISFIASFTPGPATNPRYNRWLGKVFGGLFVGAGAALLAVQR